MVARFECFTCSPGGGTSSKKADIDVATALAPNPTRSSTNLFYVAADNETISVSVTNIYGKVIRTYREHFNTGKNKIPTANKAIYTELNCKESSNLIVHYDKGKVKKLRTGQLQIGSDLDIELT
ncbi:hypothetical protein QFZ37_003203 [Chryseobacterium ginsenosidimutans]|uniref:T9SS type A sorting domain-containing protein n=1 Tax=Chryseobacterium ginsenosidimutans TaxID=687846 RepID=UPI002780EAF4|nr:T9SS type A sorting domain-containing protein [Chryseobacterium ginsenosidimutans]MDQ0594834.1 hypothetical protein [Chryseobacterium ginsenosidimutans]